MHRKCLIYTFIAFTWYFNNMSTIFELPKRQAKYNTV